MHESKQLEIASDILCDRIDAIWAVIDVLSVDEVAAEENAEFIAMLKHIGDGLGYAEMVLRKLNEREEIRIVEQRGPITAAQETDIRQEKRPVLVKRIIPVDADGNEIKDGAAGSLK